MTSLQLMIRTRAKSLGSHSTISLFCNPVKERIILLLIILVLLVSRQQFHPMGSDGMKVYLLKTGPTKKRWAVMMVGAGRSYLFTRNSFMQNVVKQLDPPMDVFTFTKKITNSSCLAELESMRLLELDSTVCRFDENYLEGECLNTLSRC